MPITAQPPPIDKQINEPKYKVTIEVAYNAVSIKDADRITANARREHVDACKVKIESEKIDRNRNSICTQYVTFGTN